MSRTSAEIKTEIESKFGFFPPFFEPALETPAVLESLWRQTLTDYLNNPIPDLFKEKLAAMLSRYCTVPYCLMCHSSSLKPLGMSAGEVLTLLETEPMNYEELSLQVRKLGIERVSGWPAADSAIENAILSCCIAIFLNQDAEVCQKKLRLVLDPQYYQYLCIYLAYNRTALSWAEMHPELSFQDDKRVQDNLSVLIADEPNLNIFFKNYQGRILDQAQRHTQWLTQENKRILQIERRRLYSYFAQAPVGFAVVEEPNHRFVMANSKYEELAGQVKFQGKTIRDVFTGDDYLSFFESLDKAYESAKGFVQRERLIRIDRHGTGKLIDVFIDITVEPYRNERGRIAGLFIVLNEVTEQVHDRLELIQQKDLLRKSQQEILAAKNLAESANSAKSAFLANMSHEIRSPLGAIMGFSDLLKADDVTKDDIKQYVAVIDRNSNHLLRVIDDILDLAKVESGKMEIEHIDFSLQELLEDFSTLMGYRARDKGIEFEILLSEQVPSIVNSDPTRLRQILNNAVGNAIKFTDRGRVTLSVSYTDKKLNFAVIDTGVGIADDQIDKLFQPFQQADASTTRKFGGTGLGLTLTRKLADALGGTFILKSSALGKGSVFVATIAVDITSPSESIPNHLLKLPEPSKYETRPDSKLLHGMKILVVEDSPDNQVLFQLMLSKAGAISDLANDGTMGVELALSKKYDVILMDIQMPAMDGHEATKILRDKGYPGPIIALTAHAMIEERGRAKKSGFTDFLSKPIDRDDMLKLLLKYRPTPPT